MLSRRTILSGLAATAPALASCAPTAKPTRLRVGYVKVLAALPYLYALDRRLFIKHGVVVESVVFGNSNDVATAAVTGNIDLVGAGATNAALDAMTAAGKLLQIFTTNNYVKRPLLGSSDFLLSLRDYPTIESLRGQPVAFFPGSFGRIFAKLVLPKLGLNVSDVDYVEMQPGQWLAAMQSGAVKAVTALEPFATQIMATLPVDVLVDGYYATAMAGSPGVPGSGSWFIKGRLSADVEGRVFAAMSEAIAGIRSDRASANEVIASNFHLEPAIVEKVRMLDWKTTHDAGAKDALRSFGALLTAQKGVARGIPAKDAWIWP